jgi:hypothetical protein
MPAFLSVVSLAGAIAFAAAPKTPPPLHPLDALARALPAAAEPRLAAFAQRAAQVRGAVVETPPGSEAAKGMPPAALLATALAQALSGLDVEAIAAMPAEDVGAVARRVWDAAAAAARPGGETPARYGKLHAALELYLRDKGYAKALEALAFARQKHTGLRRDGLTPEFQHQVEIALFLTTLKDVRDLERVLTVALLHDVVEDYPVRREEISARFGREVEDSVWRLTKVYDGQHKPYPEYFAALAEDPAASLVKGADRVHNLQSMGGVFSLRKQREYAEEARRWFLPMLKKARRSFPDQAAAYLNVEHLIKSQLQLIDAFLDAADAREKPAP